VKGERAAVAWSALYFFSLLSGYSLLRPIRDEMGIRGGVDKLPLLFTATFVAMLAAVPLWSWLVARVPRRRAIPWVNRFFALNLVAFWALLEAGTCSSSRSSGRSWPTSSRATRASAGSAASPPAAAPGCSPGRPRPRSW
jgi:hypothetical protein